MVVDLIRKEEDIEVIPWSPMSLDLFVSTEEGSLPETLTPRMNSLPDLDRIEEAYPTGSVMAQIRVSEEEEDESASSLSVDVQASLEQGYQAGYADGQKAGHGVGYEAGRQAGYDAGHQAGYDAGHEAGYGVGYEEASSKGYEDGHEKGATEGFQQGEAAGLAEGREKGREEGHEEGYAAGLKEGSASGLAKSAEMAKVFDQFKNNVAKADQALAEDLLALAIQIADQILSAALKVQPDLLLPVVSQAIQTLPQSNQPIRILLHPDDLPMVEGFLVEQALISNCTIVAEPSIEAGGCRLETGSALVDASLSNRRERVLNGIGASRDWLGKQGISDGGRDHQDG